MRRYGWIAIALALLALWAWQSRPRAPLPAATPPVAHGPATPSRSTTPTPTGVDDATRERWPDFLPPQALDTLRLIASDGPFPYRQDGVVFGNRERRLPPQPRGYYREYTVDTPGSRDRGARRIVSGGGVPGQRPPVEFFYSDDHYRSFRRFVPADGAPP